MKREEVISRLEYLIERGVDKSASLLHVVSSLKEQQKRESECQYCKGKSALYQHTNHTRLYINTFGKARTLVTECIPCPPFANCCLKNNSARSAFIIKFCPECGRKLEVQDEA